MKSIYKNKGDVIKKIIIGLLVIILMSVAVWFAVTAAADAHREQSLKIVENGLRRSALECYANEGIYPESIDYLIENYGLYINEDEYIVHYSPIASNIMPDIRVIEK